jgi:hypothetical protein
MTRRSLFLWITLSTVAVGAPLAIAQDPRPKEGDPPHRHRHGGHRFDPDSVLRGYDDFAQRLREGVTSSPTRSTDLKKTNIAEVTAKLDIECILRSWKLKRIVRCREHGRTRTRWQVENLWPSAIVETLRRHGETHLTEAESFASASASNAKTKTGSHAPGGTSSATFEVVGVYTYIPPPPPDLDDYFADPEGPPFAPVYRSEPDPAWSDPRLANTLDGNPKPSKLRGCEEEARDEDCWGFWGARLLRTGWNTGKAPQLASLLSALRGDDVASQGPAGGRPALGHQTDPATYPLTNQAIQQILPHRTQCKMIGDRALLTDPDLFKTNPDLGHLYVIFRRFLEPEQDGSECEKDKLVTERTSD